MLTWISAVANGIIFVFSIWFSRFHDLSKLWHWLLMAIAVLLIMWITAAKEAKADRQAHQQASSHRFAEHKLTALEDSVNVMKDEKEQEKVIHALEDYYEEIIRIVGEAEIVDPLSARATRGLFPSSGRVRDVIRPPKFEKQNS